MIGPLFIIWSCVSRIKLIQLLALNYFNLNFSKLKFSTLLFDFNGNCEWLLFTLKITFVALFYFVYSTCIRLPYNELCCSNKRWCGLVLSSNAMRASEARYHSRRTKLILLGFGTSSRTARSSVWTSTSIWYPPWCAPSNRCWPVDRTPFVRLRPSGSTTSSDLETLVRDKFIRTRDNVGNEKVYVVPLGHVNRATNVSILLVQKTALITTN